MDIRKKKSRTQKRFVYNHKSELGWGLPNVYNYYEAVQLKTLLEIGAKNKQKWIRFEDEANNGAGRFGIFTNNVKEDLKSAMLLLLFSRLVVSDSS